MQNIEELAAKAYELDTAVRDSEEEVLIKSKERVNQRGEVFTPFNIVQDMMNMDGVREETFRLESTVLEPSCGNGAFLVSLIARKVVLARTDSKSNFDTDIIHAVSTIYGVDIMPDNIAESRGRMMKVIEEWYNRCGFKMDLKVKNCITYILKRNIVLGNTLTFEKVYDAQEVSGRFADKRCYESYGEQKSDFENSESPIEGLLMSEWKFDGDMVTRVESPFRLGLETYSSSFGVDGVHEYDAVNILNLARQEDFDNDVDIDCL